MRILYWGMATSLVLFRYAATMPASGGFGKCSAARFEDRGQSGAVIGIAQHDAELPFDQRIGDPLVVGPKAARHRRQRCRVERFERRRGDAEEGGGRDRPR